jgi:hypothetical protein
VDLHAVVITGLDPIRRRAIGEKSLARAEIDDGAAAQRLGHPRLEDAPERGLLHPRQRVDARV